MNLSSFAAVPCFPLAIGFASSGCSDLARLRIASGVSKILLAGGFANGILVAVENRYPSLPEACIISGSALIAGLIHRVLSCCNHFTTRADARPQFGSASNLT